MSLRMPDTVGDERPDRVKYRMEHAARVVRGSVLGRMRVARWMIRALRHRIRNSLLRPRIGRLCQHKPRPLRIPEHYMHHRLLPHPPSMSIVTPSLNQAPMLDKTIASVLDQQYPHLQYIVQDGGSSDGTLEVLQKWDGRLHHWASAPDGGQANAINLGFDHATGRIMAYLNSDDLLLPGSLSYVAEFFETHPEIDVVYGHRVLIDENDDEIGRWILPPHDDEVLSWADYVPQETLFWRRSVWEKIGACIDETFRFAIDWDLILRMREAGARFARLPRFLGAFRVHPQQKTSVLISDVGIGEMNRLRRRVLGHVPDQEEVHLHVAPYLLRHLYCHAAYRLGFKRY